MSQILCSVVVPSYNRRESLEMVLEGLAAQRLDPELFEVLAILDGSTDSSVEMLAAWERSGRIKHFRWHRQENSGQATARNTGAQMATGRVVLFLDDDIVPLPDLLEIHARWHAQDLPRAVFGDCEVVCEAHDSFYQRNVWAWWEDLYHTRALPGRKPGCRDFCAGNVSLRREDFLRVGGFDTGFRGYGGEDYELGYRLLAAGIEFVADRSARALHYHRTHLAGLYRNNRQAAHGDVLLARKHPELLAGLRLMYTPGRVHGLLARIAMRQHAGADLIPKLFLGMLVLLERLGMYGRWLSVSYYLRGYAYWRGVHDIFGSWEALQAFRASAPPLPELRLDITDGVPAEIPGLWVEGPSKLQVYYRGRRVGTVPIDRPIEGPVREAVATQLMNYLTPQIWLARLLDQPAAHAELPR